MSQELKPIKPEPNAIFRGDNRRIMRAMPDGFVDLCYIDPPFFTKREYKNLWGDKESVLDWNETKFKFSDKAKHFEDEVNTGEEGLTAYLTWMRQRIVEIHRMLKPSGSLFLHLDYHASHYVKVILDQIFGHSNFRNEIIWKRTVGGSNTSKKQFGVTTDTILFYSKSKSNWKFNIQYAEYSEKYIKSHYTRVDSKGRRYRLDNLTAPSFNPRTIYKYKSYEPPKNGWRWTFEKMEEMDRQGYVFFPKDKCHRLQQIRYLDEQKGVPLSNLWDDIPPVNSQAKEDTGWPTQKPLALLERVIQSASDEGDLIFDGFAGCGTSLVAAHNLKRNWIGIDVSSTAVSEVMRPRLEEVGARVTIYDEHDLPVEL